MTESDGSYEEALTGRGWQVRAWSDHLGLTMSNAPVGTHWRAEATRDGETVAVTVNRLHEVPRALHGRVRLLDPLTPEVAP